MLCNISFGLTHRPISLHLVAPGMNPSNIALIVFTAWYPRGRNDMIFLWGTVPSSIAVDLLATKVTVGRHKMPLSRLPENLVCFLHRKFPHHA